MAIASWSRFLRGLTRRMAAETLRDQSDRELVERFLARQDEAGFEALVRRHGPMVYRVCWRVLQHSQDSEDAFQATFLVLAQKLRTVRNRDSLASWLHGVAHRVAQKARAQAAARYRHQRRAALSEAVPPDEVPWRELRTVLDAELASLPERLRQPLILCYLAGHTQEEAAGHLGWSKSTLIRRLEQARTALGRRLTRRGVVWPAALSAVLLSDCAAQAALPPGLIGSAVEAAAADAAGGAAPSAVSAKLAAFSEGVLDIMWMNKMKIVAGVLVLAGVVLGGVWLVGAGWLAADEPEPPRGGQEAQLPAPEPPSPAGREPRVKPGRLLLYRQGHLTLIGPDGTGEQQVSKNRDKFMPGSAKLSPDGKRLAFLIQAEGPPIEGVGPRRKVYVRGLDEPEPGTDLNVEGQAVMWSPDGTQLIAEEFISAADPKAIKIIHWLVDVKTKEKTALKLPENHWVTDWSRDGKHFVTTALGSEKGERTSRLHVMNRDGTEAQALTDGRQLVVGGRLSPDGRKVLYLAPDPERKKKVRSGLGLFVLDVQSRKSLRVEGQPLNGEFMGFCWSPDGKHIAYAWRQVHEKEDTIQPTESNLIVADADGKNAVTIATEKGDSSGLITIGEVDWR
jgi:RNA polymerase sigma factor (sigma-70 family)